MAAGLPNDFESNYRRDYLWSKIKYAKIPNLKHRKKDNKIYLFNSTTNFDDIFENVRSSESTGSEAKTFARRIRTHILKLDKTFSEHFDQNDPLRNIPIDLRTFIQHLLLGSKK